MKKLKISFAQFWGHFDKENIFLPILQKHFDVEIDDKNPDVLFYSVYAAENIASKYNCKKIFFCLEHWHDPKFKIPHDFSIRQNSHTKTNFNLPGWQYYYLWGQEKYKEALYNRIRHQEFDRFCSFTVSNPGNFWRNNAFKLLNNYKRVHSYGSVMNNSSELKKIDTDFWREGKDEFFNSVSHKFSICCENIPSKSGVTEKLMDAFLVGSLPIYTGAHKVAEDFNEKAFINITNMNNSDLYTLIKKLDTDKSSFDEYYNEPVFTPEQKIRLEENLELFEHKLLEVINN